MSTSSPSAFPERGSRLIPWLLVAVILATIGAYSRTFSVPFLFDDQSAIVTNETIRQLWPPWIAFSPPPLLTVSGRPLVNWTLALNYAVSGTDPWSYHALNLLIHLAAGLAWWGAVRRTLRRPSLPQGVRAAAPSLALAATALWLLHPLATEAVTYVVQRAESLMALCYLGTLYAFVRATETGASRRWLGVAVVACTCGMLTKEVTVSVPLVVVLYDRMFVAGGFRAAWRARRVFYLALAATWIVLALLVATTGGRGGTAGFSTDISPTGYALTQLRAIALYLKLAVWPHPLIFDYGTAIVRDASTVLLPGAVMLALAIATGTGIWRRAPIAFLGAWFFLVLLPTSSVMPIATQTMAEHRMYLPLAPVLLALLLLGFRSMGRGVFIAAAIALLGFVPATFQRNELFRDELALWRDTAAKMPGNARAHYNLAVTLAQANRAEDAVLEYERAVQLEPDYVEAYNNLGVALDRLGRHAPALENYTRSVRLDPGNPESQNNLGYAFARTGRFTEALPHYEAALKLRTDYPEAHNNLGESFASLGRLPEAIAHFEAAVRLRPGYAAGYNNLGAARFENGDTAAAIVEFERALTAKPDFVDAHLNLGLALLRANRRGEAATHYQTVLRLVPAEITALNNLGYIALQENRPSDAQAYYEQVAQLQAADPAAQYNVGVACARAGRWREAVSAFERAVRLKPDYAEAQRQLAIARARLGPS